MANLSLTEKDQGLLRLLTVKQAGAVLHRLLGCDAALDDGSEAVYQAILEGERGRCLARDRKRKSRSKTRDGHSDRHVTVTGMSRDGHGDTPPFFPPSSFPPTPPISSPPYYPPTTTTSASAQQSEDSSAIGLFLDRVNPLPSEYCRGELCAFVEALGNDLVHRVIGYALDNKAGSWPYIRSILRDCKREGLSSIEAWNEREEERERRKQHGASTKPATPGSAKDADDAWGIRGTVIAGD